MQYSWIFIALVTVASAAPRSIVRRDVNPALVPDFGVTPGIPSSTQPGNCQGLTAAPIQCNCPPSRDVFLAKLNKFVAQGNVFGIPVSFPEGDDADSITQQNNALVNTLQNVDDTTKGAGCPQGAAVFKQGPTRSGDAGQAGGASAASQPAASPVARSPVAASSVAASLIARSLIGESSIARSPVAASPVARSPVAASPVVKSSVSASLVAPSPVAPSPVARSPVAASPVVKSSVSASLVAASPVAASPVAASPVAASLVAPSSPARGRHGRHA